MKELRAASCLVILALLVAAAGCGKKGPPQLPEKSFSLMVSGLKAEWDGSYFLLSGRFNQPGRAEESVSGCRVFFAGYPLDNPPCETCPVEFHGHHGFGPEVVREEGFVCRVPGKTRGQVYFFKVQLISTEGVLGPESDHARVEVKS